MLRPIEPFHVLHCRRSQQRTIERVRPRVIRALDRLTQLAARVVAKPSAAVAADIEVGVQNALAVAHNDHTLGADVGDEESARLGELGSASDTKPVLAEDFRPFGVQRLG
jgi:hypothetical protein